MRRFALPLCLLVSMLAPAGASASLGGLRHSSVKLAGCDVTAHSATFEGAMRAFGKATGLQMRFTLQARSEDAPWSRVEAPSFDEWLSADPGKKQYVYDKQLNNLAAGAAYRTIVRFRWRTAAGDVVVKALKRTPACRQPDDRANLLIDKISVRAGTSADTRIYVVRVVNDGDSDVPSFSAGLQVNGSDLPPRTVTEPLAEGDETTVEFEAAPCAAGSSLIATVDTGGTVDESDETDNGFTAPCPVV